MPLPSKVSTAISNLTDTVTAAMSNNDITAEEKRFQEEVAEVKAWWQDSRWRFTKRPFTAEQIVSKRGNLKPTYANNAMSKKLWATIESRWAVCPPTLPSLRITNKSSPLHHCSEIERSRPASTTSIEC